MSFVEEPSPLDPDHPSESAEAPRRGYPLLAWAIILAAVAFIVIRVGFYSQGAKSRVNLLLFQVQARMFVGITKLLGNEGDFYEEVRVLNRGSAAQRLRFVTLAGEVSGAPEALAVLKQIEQLSGEGKIQLTDSQKKVVEILRDHYQDDKKPETISTSEANQALLLQELGWAGELLVPSKRSDALVEARRSAIAILVAVGLFLPAAGIGFLLLVLLLVLRQAGRLASRVVLEGPGGIYAETFALWMVLYLALGYVTHLLPRTRFQLAVDGLTMLTTLGLALLWPWLRGLDWADTRRAIGLEPGQQPLQEILYGFVCYLVATPILILGVILAQALMRAKHHLFGAPDPLGPGDAPTHPIITEVVTGGWIAWAQVLFVAAIVAPLVEEIIFRGVLYRHLRGLMPAIPAIAGVSFLFAVIHPQGVMGVPAIMGLAFAFNAFREWRGTLVPGMIAHGLNNGMVTVLLVLMTV